MLEENAKALGPDATARDGLPRLDLLRSFAVAARTLSFTQAAQQLALTQSAVSRQIQQMEEGLGVALFERRHRALALTPAGETMARAVNDCLERLRDATASVRSSQRTRQVAVTTTPGFASLWLIPRLARFSADHPQVDVLVSATNDLVNLERSHIDVAVRFCDIGQGRGTPLFEETVLPVCAPRLLQDAKRPLRTPADLAQHTLLVMEGHHGMPPMADWAPWLALMRLGNLRGTNTLRFSNYNDAVAAALAGQGVAIGRLPLVASLLRDGQLVTPFGGSGHSQRGYFVAAAPQAATNADAQDFIAWLHAEAQLPW
jgi:LysR family glycine cleavage system transcriptional activator